GTARTPVPEVQLDGRVSDARRREVLSLTIQEAARRGARVQSQDDYSAVLVFGRPVNHLLHAILTIFLLGLWLFVWIPLALFEGEERTLVVVDEYGRMSMRSL